MQRFLPFALAALFCGAAVAQTSDLLISEYVEGSAFNKAIELYNGTGSAVDLEAEGYYLRIFFNGNTTAGSNIALTGTVANDDVFVIAEDDADSLLVLPLADQLSGSLSFNGDDAVVLFRDSTMIVDAIGQVGFDPGSEWGMDSTSTANNTLRRLSDACDADADTSDVFDPAVNYIGFPQDTFDGLGSASFDCGTAGPNFDLTASLSAMTVAPGGSFTVNFTVANNTANPVTGDLFFTASPGGLQASVFNDQTISGNASVSNSYTQNVPGNAPLGIYTYTVRIGQFPNTTVDAEAFSVIVTGSARGTGTTWSVSDLGPWQEESTLAASAVAERLSVFPNPLAREAEIAFSLERAADVSLVVYDVRGREVARLVDRALDAGAHRVAFDASSLSSGVYVYRLVSGTQVETGRMTVVR
ncbi:MAG: lamin tail domain-containing protein [Bacteroidota bacterium]